MERLPLEVIISPITSECAKGFVGNNRKLNTLVSFHFGCRSNQTILALATYRDDADAQGFEIFCGRSQQVDLLDTVRTARAQIENHEHCPGLVIRKRMDVPFRIGESPIRRIIRIPTEWAEGIEVRPFANICLFWCRDAPISGKTQANGDRIEPGEDRRIHIKMG